MTNARRSHFALLTLAAALGGTTRASAQTSSVDPRLYSALEWRNIGPFRGGRVSATTGVIGSPNVYYVGFPNAGVWKTTNAGVTWVPIFDAIKTVSSVGAVEVAPSDSNVVYVGTGDMVIGGINQGDGVYKSTDAGRTWTTMGLADSRHIPTILVDTRNPNVVLVGALGDHMRQSDTRGVFRSTDGGKTWSKTLFIDKETGIAKLARAFDMPDVIWATSMHHYAGPNYTGNSIWSFGIGTAGYAGDSARSGTKLYKSIDGGITWQESHGVGLPRLTGRASIAVAMNTHAQRLYLITNDAFYRSDDGGNNWRQMASDDTRIRNGQGGYSCGVYVDPVNPDIVYTINTASYKSIDGGKTFTGLKGSPGGDDPQQLWIDPTNGQHILMGLDQGAVVTLDGGNTWSTWYNQSTEQIYHISADASFPYWIYGTQQDAGAIRTRARGNYGAVTFFDWNSVNTWEWGTIVPDPRDPNTIFASGNGIVRLIYPSEQWINISPATDPGLKARSTQSAPLVWAPWNPRMLIAGMNMVMTTVDGGNSWKRISPDLGLAPGMDSATADKTRGARGAIESLSASSAAPNEIWAGTNNGMIHLTRDGGASWRNVSIANLPNALRANVTGIEASPFDAGTAYAAIEYMRLGDHGTYFYRTRDFGKSWTKIIDGLPTDEPSGSFARVIRADPKTRGLLYAGTESGVHVSFDDGNHWQSLRNNLPNVPVRDILIRDNDVIIATHGRGIYVLDDMSMLRQLVAPVATSAPYFFAPGNAVRVHRNVNADTPLQLETPQALNPEVGVAIYYWLPTRATGEITLEVLDATQTVVRRLTSTATPPVAEAARPNHPNFWVRPPLALATESGAHRVYWDLRHDAPNAFTHTFEINANPGLTPPSPEGAMVPPGTYTLRLTVDGHTMSRTAVIRNDPRSRATQMDLQQQHTLQMHIMSFMNASFDDDRDARALRADVARFTSESTEQGIRTAALAIVASIDSVTGDVQGRRGRGAPGGTETFRSINNALGAQLNAQDNADARPTAGMYAALSASCKHLNTAERTLQRIAGSQLTSLNAALMKSGSAKITVPHTRAPSVCA